MLPQIKYFNPLERKLIHFRAAYKTNMCKYSASECKYNENGLCYYAHSAETLRPGCCLDYYILKQCNKHKCNYEHLKELYNVPPLLLKKAELDFNIEVAKITQLTKENNELKHKRKRVEDDLEDEINYSKRKREEYNGKLDKLTQDLQSSKQECLQKDKEIEHLKLETNLLRIQLEIMYQQLPQFRPPYYSQ